MACSSKTLRAETIEDHVELGQHDHGHGGRLAEGFMRVYACLKG